MRRLKSLFRADERGGAAVEFALVAPVFALAVVLIGDYANLVLRYYDMRAAVTSAAQYIMQAGTSGTLSTAQSVATSAWSTRNGGSVTVTNACLCGSTATACNVLCADQSVPKSYTTISASSSYSGTIISQSLSASQVVRVR
jgi:Flp pilus assembly protein TadG